MRRRTGTALCEKEDAGLGVSCTRVILALKKRKEQQQKLSLYTRSVEQQRHSIMAGDTVKEATILQIATNFNLHLNLK